MKESIICLLVVVILLYLFGWVFPLMVSSHSTGLVLIGIVGAVISLGAGIFVIIKNLKSLQGKLNA